MYNFLFRAVNFQFSAIQCWKLVNLVASHFQETKGCVFLTEKRGKQDQGLCFHGKLTGTGGRTYLLDAC